jgi:hypothetical protein
MIRDSLIDLVLWGGQFGFNPGQNGSELIVSQFERLLGARREYEFGELLQSRVHARNHRARTPFFCEVPSTFAAPKLYLDGPKCGRQNRERPRNLGWVGEPWGKSGSCRTGDLNYSRDIGTRLRQALSCSNDTSFAAASRYRRDWVRFAALVSADGWLKPFRGSPWMRFE